MKLYITLLTALLFPFLLNAQTVDEEAILFTVGAKPVTAGEFLFMFNKANPEKEAGTRQAKIDEYLELYINLKLKVLDAEAANMNEQNKFVKEYEDSRQQLIQSYLTDKNISEKLIQEGYERLKEEVNVSHLLIEVEPGASIEEEEKALKKINLIRKQIVDDGKDFEEMAYRYSNDPSAKDNRGSLGYISAFQTVYPFETAAYTLKEGSISSPIRSQFGFHLLKIKEKRKSKGEISVSHILIKSTDDAPENIQKNNENKADSVYNLLSSKTIDWDAAVKKFSQDNSTNRKFGMLPAFSAGKMVPDFEAAAFGLQNDGDIAAPVKTSLGWHIIKRNQIDEMGTLQEEQANVRRRVEKDSRSDLPKQSFVDRIKKENNFKEELDSRNELINRLDVKVLRPGWKVEDYSNFNKTLFTLNDKTYNQADFLEFLHQNQHTGSTKNIKAVLKRLYDDYLAQTCTELETSLLENRYPDFKWQLKEYYDGLLFFEITEKEVWKKSTEDQVGLKAYFDKHGDAYVWDERVDASIYKTDNQTTAKKLQKLAKRKKLNIRALEKYPDVEVVNGAYEANQNKYINAVKWKAGAYGPSLWENQYVVVWIKEVITPVQKTLDEARGYVTSDFQTFLEEKWVANLRKKYDLIINEKTLKALYQ